MWGIYSKMKIEQIEAAATTARIRGEISAWHTLQAISTSTPLILSKLDSLIVQWSGALDKAQAELDAVQEEVAELRVQLKKLSRANKSLQRAL